MIMEARVKSSKSRQVPSVGKIIALYGEYEVYGDPESVGPNDWSNNGTNELGMSLAQYCHALVLRAAMKHGRFGGPILSHIVRCTKGVTQWGCFTAWPAQARDEASVAWGAFRSTVQEMRDSTSWTGFLE